MTQDEIIAHNMGVSLDNDLRPSWDALARFKQDYVAKCPTGKHLHQVGLGFQGVGSQWCLTPEGFPKDALDALPIKQCLDFWTGKYSCADSKPGLH